MTINVNTSRNEYTATSGQTVFNFTFKIYTATDLNVYVTPAGQECDDVTDLTEAYTVTGVGLEDGGSITLNTGAGANDLVTIASAIPTSRTTDYQSNGDFTPETVNNDIDRAISLIKQVESKANRSLLSSECLQGPKPLTLPRPESGEFVRWKTDLSGLENVPESNIIGGSIVKTDYVKVLDTVAEMVADTSLVVGQTVRTQGYTLAGDGGGNYYEIVAASTGTDDGGSYIDLGTYQAKASFVGGISVKQFGATGDGTTDDSTAIQAAISYAESLTGTSAPTIVSDANISVSLSGSLYAIASGLTISKNIKFTGGSLLALSTFSDIYMLTIESTAERAVISDIDFDGGLEELTVGTPGTWDRYADIIANHASRIVIKDVTGIHFPNYGLRMIEAQASHVTNVLMREWAFSEQGTTYGTLRTAKAFSVEDADGKFIACVGAQSLYPLYVSGDLNMFTGCHFYNGASTTTTEDISIYLDAVNNTILTGCYIDNGSLFIKDSFNQNITGCHFQRTSEGTNTSAIRISTSAVSEQVDGLVVVGGTFNGSLTSGEIDFTGSGSYVDDLTKLIVWVGNTRTDGSAAWHVAKFSGTSMMDYGISEHQASGAGYILRSPKGVKISADYDNNSGGDESKVTFATDGTDKWEVLGNGALVPSADNTYALGSQSNILSNALTARVALKDGISAPSTISGFAQIYVQSSDGDLKIKFGDGTVKTIVTDT
jgi:hypothetical protein